MSYQAPLDPAAIPPTFSGNEWLIEELYEQYRRDPHLVDPAWWDFFEDYRRGAPPTGDGARRAQPAPLPAGSPPAAPASPPSPATPREEHEPAAHAAPATATPGPTPAPAAPSADPRAQLPTVEHVRADLPPVRPAPAARPATAEYVSAAPRLGARAAGGDDDVSPLRGPAARVVTNMEASLAVPTATSVRAIPAKLLVDNRIVINNHLARARGGKVSFTHLIGFAVVEALADMPAMNAAFREVDGRPALVRPAHVNLGIAIDLARPNGTRQLLVPSVKSVEAMDFATFWVAYEDVVRRARAGALTPEDFAGTTITLTNPGTIGTVHSVPRLMAGQGAIIGVGAMEYPAEFQGSDEETLARLGVSKVLTLTSTYDHRIIQGAQSGEFLQVIHRKLLGEDGFYDRVLISLRIPYEPVRWTRDRQVDPESELGKPAHIARLIHAYRSRGHLMADTDPLAYRQRRHPDLDVQNHGLTLWDLDRTFPTGGFGGAAQARLRDILGRLRDAYCRTIGVEYMHLHDPAQRQWMQERLESGYRKPHPERQLQILHKLNAAEAFETFLQTKYVGQKRFSLEGAESLIPLLDAILTLAAGEGLDEVGIGMAHRGRLNVLANIAGKSYTQIFAEFEGNQDPRSVQGSGDVKYHLGTEGVFTAPDGEQTRVYLAANPSHLEAVNGVLEGIVRAKQDRIDLGGRGFSVLPVLIHGDAAFAGQGVVTETLNLSQLRGYRTGGTIHVIVNNQIGFTTGASYSRSTLYCTDVAKGLQIPIFHVNGDDPEAVARVGELAYAYRQEFNKDVVIDLVCYRRRGHNEGDDPSMTQPVMYGLIEKKRSVRKLYTEALIGRGDLTVEQAEAALQHFHSELERAFTETRHAGWTPPVETEPVAGLERPESQLEDAGTMVGWRTATSPEVLQRVGAAHGHPPEGFTVHPKLLPLLARRERMSNEGRIDWAYAEILAFGSLLLEGTPVRLAGQDSRRGTFVQRHAVFHDRQTGAEWTPLTYLSDTQAKFFVYDSSLSEFAAMAFEYGYSVERPEALVLWEAQFGDFANGGQTIVDEFISSSEQKWGQRSSVVLLLPHGYEGQGPDHSSARIERYLQLCAEGNMTVAAPSTPASYFHLLRQQAYRRPRRPLVVFTPKSMLRHKGAVSAVDAFTTGSFEPVLGDPTVIGARNVLMCAGKIYYDLVAERERRGAWDTAIVRLEQFYPLDVSAVGAALDHHPDATVTWVQDEPANQGAWLFVSHHLRPAVSGRSVARVSRLPSASTAAGSHRTHEREQAALIEEAFAR